MYLFILSPVAEGVLCAIICPLIFTVDPCSGPIGDFKKLVDIPDVGKKGDTHKGTYDCTQDPLSPD